ncbi:pentapeptide repeat-containing protein [Mycobacterium sp. NPDC050853]|uniref:pentapeptide repeat-containing protein n=1 Tax=Mycobacterium sp. NPDC050853 TaxID=3155160 RepID=UPI0033CE4BE3
MAQLGEIGRDKHDECDTIVSILCAQLKKTSHLDQTLTKSQQEEEAAVNDAIISRLQVACQRGGPHGKTGAWAGRLRLDLRGADLSESLLAGVDFTGAVLKDANLYSTEFKGALLDAANLSRADVRLADFTKASMHNTIVDGTVADNNTTWPEGFVAEMGSDRIARMVPQTATIEVDSSDSDR